MKINQFAVLTLVAVMACSTDREAPNGLKVKVLKEGSGEYAAPGEFVVTSMIIKDASDSVWRETHSQNIPIILPVGDLSAVPTETGVESAFRVMKKGDSLSIDVDPSIVFKGQPLPANLKAGDKLTFVFCVKDITDRQGADQIQRDIQTREMEKSMKAQGDLLAKDTVAIDEYLAAKKINAVRDKSGVRYLVTQSGRGTKPTLSSTITFNYRVSLMDNGQLIQESTEPVVYPLSQLIKGWQIVFPLFAKGTKANLYVPSGLGYGPTGSPPTIPPNANLIFEVELVDFKD